MVVLPLALRAEMPEEGWQCPARNAARRLQQVSVFSGLPEQRAELAPRPGGWDFGPRAPSDLHRYTLLCRYEGAGQSVTIVLPLDVRVCEFTARTWPHVVCR